MHHLGFFCLVPVGLSGLGCGGNGCGGLSSSFRICDATRRMTDGCRGTGGGGRCGCGCCFGGFHPGGGTLSRSAATFLVFFIKSPQPDAGGESCKYGGVPPVEDRIQRDVAPGLVTSTTYGDAATGSGHSCGLINCSLICNRLIGAGGVPGGVCGGGEGGGDGGGDSGWTSGAGCGAGTTLSGTM